MNLSDVSTNVLGIGDLFEKPLVANRHDLERIENEISKAGVSDSRGGSRDHRAPNDDAVLNEALADLMGDVNEFAVPMSKNSGRYSKPTATRGRSKVTVASTSSVTSVSDRGDRRKSDKNDRRKSRTSRGHRDSDSESSVSSSASSRSSRSSRSSASSSSSKSSRSTSDSRSSRSESSDRDRRRDKGRDRQGKSGSRDRSPVKIGKDSKWNRTHYREAPSARPNLSKDEYKRENETVDNILGLGYSSNNINTMLIPVKREKWRIQTLANIKTLRESLEDDIDVAMMKLIPEVDYESDDKAIENVYEMLQYIDRRQSNYAITSSVVDMSCQAVGEFFDGTRSVFGVKPHLKGLNETVMARLKKMEFQATELTENIMQENGIIGWKRIMMESLVAVYTHHKSNVLRESTGTSQRNVSKQAKDSLQVLNDL